jgi:heme exporter protein B
LSWAHEAVAVFAKEVRAEWRTRVAVSATGLFAVGSLTLMMLALRVHPPVALKREPLISVATALLWLLLYFTAVTGLGRAFVLEEERGTALALRLTARATVVWAGKFAFNALLLFGLAVVTTPLLLAALEIDVATANLSLLACVLTFGCVGMAAVLTMTSALVAQATAKGGLLAVLSLPVLTPLFTAAVHGTRAALGVGTMASRPPAFVIGLGDLEVLVSYAVVSVTASLLLFGFVWEE